MPGNRALFIKNVELDCYAIMIYSSLGGHSGEGSVSASGFPPQAEAKSATVMADKPSKKYSKKLLLVFIVSPLNIYIHFYLFAITRVVYQKNNQRASK